MFKNLHILSLLLSHKDALFTSLPIFSPMDSQWIADE